MTDTIRDLIGELDAFAKQANAADGVESLPGSENDKPIPSGATKPDPKTKDETIDAPAERSLEGAKPDGDIPASNVNKMEADEAVLNPDRKALDTADANAKEASALGNSLIDMILKGKQKQAEQAKQASAPKAPAEKKVAQPATKQAAPDNTITLDMALMAKIAAITLADEEGQLAVQAALTKRAGAEFANELLDTLEKRAAEEQAAWEFEKGAQDAEAMIGDMQEAQGAADAEAAMGDLQEAQDAAAAAGAEGEEAGSVEDAAAALDDYSSDEIVEAVQELAQEGQIPEDQAQAVIQAVTEGAGEEGSAEDISEDDLAEAIVEAVESGELSEEDAQALVQAISEGDAGDAEADQQLAQDVAGADAAAAAGDEAAAGADEAAAAEAEKAAAAKEYAEKRASFKEHLASILRGNR